MGKFKQLENMMLNIVNEGEETIWNDIEFISNPVNRFQERHLYFLALEKLKEKLKGGE